MSDAQFEAVIHASYMNVLTLNEQSTDDEAHLATARHDHYHGIASQLLTILSDYRGPERTKPEEVRLMRALRDLREFVRNYTLFSWNAPVEQRPAFEVAVRDTHRAWYVVANAVMKAR